MREIVRDRFCPKRGGKLTATQAIKLAALFFFFFFFFFFFWGGGGGGGGGCVCVCFLL